MGGIFLDGNGDGGGGHTQSVKYVREKRREKIVIKNHGWEPVHQKHKPNENTRRHNPKKKQKQKNQPKSGKHDMQSEVIGLI
jgi:hypothetical protein